jgi:hypothetical protein
MGFLAETFIFAGIPSETMNVYLGTINDSGESTTSGSQDVALLTQKLFRRPVPLFYGVDQLPVLSFPLSMYSKSEITAVDYSIVSSWLFGQMDYQELQICQSDMQDIKINCFLTSPQVTRVGNFIQSMTTTVVADSPWGWSEPKTYTYTFADSYSSSQDIVFLNESANNFYTFPTSLIITANIFGGSISITNTTDNNRVFTLGTITDPLLPNEVITMNPDAQTISSNLVTYPISKFNLNWLRLLSGYNLLTIEGNVSSVSLTYPIAVKIG